MTIGRREFRILIAIGFIIGIVAVPALAALLNGVPTAGTVPLESNSGPRVFVEGASNMSLEAPFPDGNTVDVKTDSGNVTVSSSARTNATIAASNITGTWTKVSGISATSSSLKINPEDKRAINVSGGIDRIEFRNANLDDGKVDFVYAGAAGTSTVTVRGLDANTQVRAVDANTGDILDTDTTDGSGVATFDGMTNSEHSVELKTGSANPILQNPTPDGNVSTQPSEFSVDVSDDEFPGDNVTLEWYYEGSKFNTTYATSDGRYAVTNPPSVASGVHEWSIVATDENGNKDVVNATVGQPGTLYIRNETNASELVNSPINVTVAFKNGTTVTTRTTSDGTIDMTGLPTTDFVVTVEANSDYHKRVVYFQSIIGNQSVYLLNKSYNSVESRFTLDDPTGKYPANSFVIIKKSINRSGTTKYRTIYSDKFGTEGVTMDLEKDERYLVSVRNPEGLVQQIGPYRSDVGEDVTVRPGSPTIELGSYEEGWAYATELNNRTLEFRYDDPENQTQEVTVWVHQKGNKSNLLRPNVSYYDLGSFSGTYTLTENESKKTWVVNFVIDRDGEVFTTKKEVANKADLVPDLSREWRLIAGIGLLLISAGVFSLLNASVGGVVVAIEGGVLWWTGWLTGATTGAAVVIALFVAVLFHIYSSSSP